MIITNDFYTGSGFKVSEDECKEQLNVCVLARCPFKCFYCNNQQYHKQNTDFVELTSKILDCLSERNLTILSLQSGEFFSDKELQWMVNKILKIRNINLHLFSNGYMFSLEALKELGWIDVCKKFTLSVYGSSDEEYYDMVGVERAFTRVMKNYNSICRLKNYGIEVNVNVLRPNVSEEEKIVYRKLLNTDNINFSTIIKEVSNARK